MAQKQYMIDGFDCANCAIKVENHLNKDQAIASARIDFAAKRLHLQYRANESYSIDELLLKIKEVEHDPITIQPLDKERRYTTPIWTKSVIFRLARIFVGLALMIAALLLERTYVTWPSYVFIALYLSAYAVVAYDVVYKALRNLLRLQDVFDENILMSVATLGAFAIGEHFEAVLVILLSQVGEVFQSISVNKSRNTIIQTMDLRPNIAHLFHQGVLTDVEPKNLSIGDTILVKVGEIIPVDGFVVEGSGSLDTSSLTGEFLPQGIRVGDEALSGAILQAGSITIQVSKRYIDSTISKILDLVTNSGEHKSKAEQFMTKFAKVYTPVVMALALMLAIVPPLFTGEWSLYLYRAFTFLVISCPCAIIISVPLTFFTGLGLASKHGIIVKGANYLDRLTEVDTLVYDKTGTITEGVFEVKAVNVHQGEYRDFVAILCAAEKRSTHPIAQAILDYFNQEEIVLELDHYQEFAGLGIGATYQGKQVYVGNRTLLEQNNIPMVAQMDTGTAVYVAYDGAFLGAVILNDTIKPSAMSLVKQAKQRHLRLVMLTGDRYHAAKEVANAIGLEHFYAELLPDGKIEKLEAELQQQKGAIAFIGDGINDAPSIMRADVGIAMGGIGSDFAVENADIVIMNDDPIKVLDAITIAKATRKKAILNILIALLVKLAVLALSAVGYAPMWLAVLADTGLSLLLVLHSLWLIRYRLKS